ncbi:exopolysaccharide biosynthesis polyprenyl glycosylphosphotransferase [Vibrio proteolyticus]|nr:exopolysaccharide biosynthesis polyprenyl glycosylphosphotransferase [Vibrio proteolyticus]
MKKLLSNSYVCHGLGILTLTSFLVLNAPQHYLQLPNTVTNSILMVIGCYLGAAVTLPHLSKYLLVERKYYILPVLVSLYALVIGIIVMMRVDYSRAVLINGFLSSFAWLYFVSLARKRHKILKLSAIPNFDYVALNKHRNIQIEPINISQQISDIHSGLVVNLHKELKPAEAKFVADCSINNISVFHSESIREMLEGKVQTCHLSENAIGTLKPNPIYSAFKRCWESALILVSLPVTLPVMLLTALLIKIENPGPAMFIQERVGQGGKVFKIYKFRSMTVRPKDSESKFATDEQARVTKVGRVIRKVRIDELPQFFNVLKGDMSLIGPRPEQESFVEQFEQEIPFYGYRHMVKPGITGWAQTVQGYADDTESTREKLAHDLYYIKHLSFWLDMNIVLKTIRTMITGFGAK